MEPNGLAAHSRFDDVEAQFHAALDAGLNPRGPDSLFAVVGGLGLPSGSSVVDIGCGRGLQALELGEAVRVQRDRHRPGLPSARARTRGWLPEHEEG